MRGRRVLSAILVVLPAIVGVATYPTTLKAALVDAPTSDDLIPKMVTTVTYSAHSAPEASPPTGPLPEVKRVGAKSLPRGGGTDLMFLGGALATVLLVAGLVFQIIGRLRQVRLTHSHHDAGAGIAQSVEEAVPVSSPTRSRSFGHAVARSDPTDDLKSKVDQWIFDLQKKSRAHVSSVSFASRAPTTEPALVED